MRTITGWTKPEIEELKWHRDSKNSLEDVFDVLYTYSDTYCLSDKFRNYDGDTDQMIIDIVDWWTDRARFPEKHYNLKNTFTGQLLAQYVSVGEQEYKYGWFLESERSPVLLTADEIKEIDVSLLGAWDVELIEVTSL